MFPGPHFVQAAADWPLPPLSVLTESRQHRLDFFQRRPPNELDRGNPVAVKPMGQIAKEGVVRIGGHRLDHQAMSRDAKSHGVSTLEQ